jgi:hypothetical protein
MKFLRKAVNILSLILFIGGVFLILITYLTNTTFVNKLTSLMTNAECRKGMLYMLIGMVCIIAAFLLFSLSVRLSSSIRRREKELEAERKAKLAEEEEKNRRLEMEAAAARADAERYKAQATQAQAVIDSQSEEPASPLQ